MRHTPGPWRYEEGTKTIRNVPGNHWLSTMDSWDGAVDHKANAALIAAAPELLEACEKVLDIVNSYSHIPALFTACKILQTAIAKAEGRG